MNLSILIEEAKENSVVVSRGVNDIVYLRLTEDAQLELLDLILGLNRDRHIAKKLEESLRRYGYQARVID